MSARSKRWLALLVVIAALSPAAPTGAQTTGRIAVVANRFIYTVTADGRDVRVGLNATYPVGVSTQAWSPRSRVLYLSLAYDYMSLVSQRWQFRTASATLRRDVAVRNFDLFFNEWIDLPVWSPDGRRVAFAKWSCVPTFVWGVGCVPTGEIFVMNVDGTKVELQPFTLEGSDPVWAPDSHHLAFSGLQGLSVVDVDSRARSPRVVSDLRSGGYLPTWSPDGGRVAFVDTPVISAPGHVWVVGADGSHLRRLGAVTGDRPAWSPDGRAIVYSAGWRNGIAIIRADGTGTHRLTRETPQYVYDGQPQWIGTSEIAYLHQTDRTDALMSVDTRRPLRTRRILKFGHDNLTTFAVDR